MNTHIGQDAGPELTSWHPTQKIRLYSDNEIQDVGDILRQVHPGKRDSYYLKIIQKYEQAILDEITRGTCSGLNLTADTKKVSFKRIRQKCGCYGPNGKQKYWFDVFQTHMPLLEKVGGGWNFVKQGGGSMLTEVNINVGLVTKASTKQYYEQKNPNDLFWIKIDLKSLGNLHRKIVRDHIPHAQLQVQKEASYRNKNFLEKIQYQQRWCESILLIAEDHNGFLPMEMVHSVFGRLYFKGINLQSSPRMVREAALGSCWKVDIEASAIVWKLCLARDINPKKRYPLTFEYIDSKQRIRRELSQRVFGDEDRVDIIKEVFAAVGFGARMNIGGWQRLVDNPDGTKRYKAYNAITEIIRSKEHRQRLLDDTWFQQFIKEQTSQSQLIFDHYKTLPEFNIECVQHLGRINQNKLLSYLYQQTERQILDALMTVVETRSQAEVLLPCHDGFYTRYKPPLADLRYTLQQFLPLARLDAEQVQQETDIYQDVKFVEEHKTWIQEEERRAALLFNKPIHKAQPLPKRPKSRPDDYCDGSFDFDTYMEQCISGEIPWYVSEEEND